MIESIKIELALADVNFIVSALECYADISNKSNYTPPAAIEYAERLAKYLNKLSEDFEKKRKF